MSDLVEKLEKRARESECLAAAYRNQPGPVPVERIEPHEARMWAYRQAARDVQEALDEPAGLTLTLTPERDVPRKLEVEATARGYRLTEWEHNGCKWRIAGSERLRDVGLEIEGFDG
ncbi:hypothetical protein [Haloferax volcanii]|uniref:hypothetical protein n=1 Tax=Haloferax volcanii TaxID=2246 RepID=UPI00249B959F|nr:hypothetical protein [Haloferax alexandrinus]